MCIRGLENLDKRLKSVSLIFNRAITSHDCAEAWLHQQVEHFLFFLTRSKCYNVKAEICPSWGGGKSFLNKSGLKDSLLPSFTPLFLTVHQAPSVAIHRDTVLITL